MEDITDVDYMHVNIVWKDFEIKHLGEYHDFYHKSDRKFQRNVFENLFLRSSTFLSAPGLAWQAALRKTEVKIE